MEEFKLKRQEIIEILEGILEKKKSIEEQREVSRIKKESVEKAEKMQERYKLRISEESAQAVKNQRERLEYKLKKDVHKAEQNLDFVTKKRAQRKERQVKSYISDATKEYRDQIREEKKELKKILKDNNMPAVFESRLCLSVFVPSKITDYILIALILLFLGILLPVFIYYLIPDHKIWQFYIILPVFVLLNVLIYMEVLHDMVNKYPKALSQCKAKKQNIVELRKKIKGTKDSIIKEDDESNYSMADWDERIEAAKKELIEMKRQQKDQLENFESHTRTAIIEEFRQQSKLKLKEMQSAYMELKQDEKLEIEKLEALEQEYYDECEKFPRARGLTVQNIEKIIKMLKADETSEEEAFKSVEDGENSHFYKR